MSELLYVMHDAQMAICTMHVYHRLSHSFAIQVTVYSDEAAIGSLSRPSQDSNLGFLNDTLTTGELVFEQRVDHA